ncbi:hypothetical protein NBH20_23230 [Rhizobium sp. S153]|uniref:Uncharacterized protein n=1 Tax=Ciceribacter sichuanensis TaxID=2949647 RepID=A0ABT0VGK5_9HYPH|nr:hypothetical protein [Ciceribacter sp. S153]MCM2404097.1 hypothetical protein [Ciceribacter sp. S153]
MKQTDLILLRGLLPGEEGVGRVADTVQKLACAEYQDEADAEKPEHKQRAGNFPCQRTGGHEPKYPDASNKIEAQLPRLPCKYSPKIAPHGAFGARLDFRAHRFSLQPLAFDGDQLSQQFILKAFLGHSMRVPLDATVSKEVASARRNFNQDMSSNANNFNHA